jgi:hypothetical protein
MRQCENQTLCLRLYLCLTHEFIALVSLPIKSNPFQPLSDSENVELSERDLTDFELQSYLRTDEEIKSISSLFDSERKKQQ